MSNNPLEGKKAKFVKGQIVLRSEKSERNRNKIDIKKEAMAKKMS